MSVLAIDTSSRSRVVCVLASPTGRAARRRGDPRAAGRRVAAPSAWADARPGRHGGGGRHRAGDVHRRPRRAWRPRSASPTHASCHSTASARSRCSACGDAEPVAWGLGRRRRRPGRALRRARLDDAAHPSRILGAGFDAGGARVLSSDSTRRRRSRAHGPGSRAGAARFRSRFHVRRSTARD